MSPEQFDDMPKILLEKDDVESFQRNRGKGQKAQKTSSSPEKEEPDLPKPSGNSPSWLAVLALLVIIVGVASYWSNLQYKSSLAAEARIAELERRLSATGEEMGQSAVALQVKVTELSEKTSQLWEQMDKLWASAWRRNQEEIKGLSRDLNTQNTTLSDKISSATSDIKSYETTVGLLQELVDSQATSIKQLKNVLVEAETSNTELKQQFSSLREKLMSTALANNNLTGRLDELEKRLKTAEEAAGKKTTTPPAAVGVSTGL
jgi:peptidoglycan hydrolase CwlO-like protein